MLHWLECIECKTRFSADDVIYTCRNCGDLLDIIYDYDELRNSINYRAFQKRPSSVWRYRELLPLRNDISPISLGEGGTRIHHCKRLGKKLGMDKLYVKMEGDNPTGSFKDRGMTVGISKALECNMKTVICASTGNTSGSLAAYASKAGLRSIILIPAGKIAKGKLAQASIYGAEIFQIKGNFDNALQLVMDLTQTNDIYLLNSINPYRIEGQKTLAFESRDQIMKNPDWIVLPVGNAGNISAIWKGFSELKELAIENTIPRFAGIQAEGAAPLAKAYNANLDTISPISNPETIATAIRIGKPVSWKKAFRAVKETRGLMDMVSDGEILTAQRDLARYEGLFVEPASAASIAGLKKLRVQEQIDKNEMTLCIATGHGLKDPDVALQSFTFSEVDADLDSILGLFHKAQSVIVSR